MGIGRTTVLAGLAASVIVLLLAAPAAADWRVYLSADLGFSVSNAKASGRYDDGTNVFPLGGSDTDTSPFVGGAVGLAVPMDEIASFELPRGWRLPDWDLRLEAEATGLRSYDFKTRPVAASTGPILSEADSWSVMTNLWLDVPLRGLYKPISWTSARLFGRWRLRTLKQVLDKTTFVPGLGIGLASFDVKTREEVAHGSGTAYNFAWQAGAGFGYQLTDRVNLGIGYRYMDPGTAKFRLRGTGLEPTSFFELNPEIHEVKATLRVEVFDFVSPWR